MKRPIHFPGITKACVALGCTREHLYRVLTGRRKSEDLSQRYASYVANPAFVPANKTTEREIAMIKRKMKRLRARLRELQKGTT